MNYLINFLYLFVLSIAFIIPQTAYAQADTSNAPIIIEEKGLTASGGKLSGSVQLTNPNGNAFNGYLTTKIMSPDTTQVEQFNGKPSTKVIPGALITSQKSDIFNVGPNGKINQNVNVDFGIHNSPGTYEIQFAVFASDGRLLGSKTAQVNLQGSGPVLKVNNCVIVVAGVDYAPSIGPNVAPNADVSGKCSVTNLTQEPLTLFSEAKYAVDSVSLNSTQIYKPDLSTIVSPNGTQEIQIPLPALEQPQVYEAMAYFKDAQGDVASPQIIFRWVIAGESASIRSITTDSANYVKGSTAKVTIGADPSMDLFWKGGGPAMGFNGAIATQSSSFVQPELQGTPLNNPTIVASIKDENGTECGSVEHKVNADPNKNIWPDQTIDVPINKDCDNVIAQAEVKNDGRVLAAKEINLNPKDAGAAGSNKYSTLIYALLGIGLLTIISGGVLWYMRRKKKLPPPVTAALLLFVLGSWFLSGNIDLANGFSFNIVTPVSAGLSAGIKHESVVAYRRGQPCPGPDWLHQPQGDDGQGGCLIGIVSSYSSTNFTALDTQNEIKFENGEIKAHIAGQFTGYGCVNAEIGLIVRAYVNNSQAGVSINGGGPRIVYNNLGLHGGGNGTPFDKNISITSTVNKCGPLDVRIEMVPFIKHVGIIASDMAEDQLLKDSDVPGWSQVTYLNRQNCGGNASCWATLQKQIDAGSCVQCGATCTSANDCQYAANGCTACLPAADGAGGRTCQTPIACGHACSNNLDCVDAINGCTSCLPNMNGQGSSCQTQPKCGTPCINPASCEGAQGGCTSCLDDGSGAKCGTCPAGMNYDPAQKKCACPNPGETNPHKVCDGDKCLSVGSCGVTTCGDDKACFAEDMCKCDGFEAVQLQYPSVNPFIFDSYAKVEGTDMTKAVVQGIKFRMYESDKSNPNAATVIAESEMYNPEIVSSTASKARYKARWTMQPPQIKANKTYRVLAEIKCVPKKKSAVAVIPANQYQSTVLGISTANAQNPEASATPDPNYLQLTTLNFIKQVNTDKCYSAGFEMQEGIGAGQ